MAKFSINDDEYGALWGLPWMARILYYEVLRPNMDFKSGVVGVRTSRTKRLNNQAIREQLEVHGGQGKSHVPKVTNDEIRWAIETLVREGVIARIVGANGRAVPFVFRCLLADTDLSARRKYNRSTTGSTTEVQQEVQHDHEPPEPSNINDFGEHQAESTTGKQEEAQQANPEKHNTPPDTDLKSNTTTARARESELIPDNFCLDESVRVTLFASGVRDEVAEYFISEFVNDCQSKGKTSFNWAAEFAVYCKKWGWRYDKERGNNAETSGRDSQQQGRSKASRAHERDKRLYQDAIAREQGAEDIHQAEGSVRAQVVVPYRGR